VSPWVIGFVLFTLGPILASGYLSLTRYNYATPPRYIGFGNYTRLFDDRIFWKSIQVTVTYTVFSVPLGLCFSLFLAVLLNQKIPFLGAYRTIFYLPYLLGMSVPVALLFRWILNPHFGIVNHFIASLVGPHGLIPLGIKGPQWLLDPDWVMPAYVLFSLWSSTGALLIYLAALQGVPTPLHEAAVIDGANRIQRFFRITLPMISPAILYTFIDNVIRSFQLFVPAYILSDKTGGPAYAATFYIFYLYTNAFRRFRAGLASAQAWIFLVILLATTALLLRITTRFVYYESGAEEGGI
jgi:multiple sugar transport system permease protein